MNVVAAAVSSVLPKLLQLLGDEYKLQRDLKEKVKSLSDELRYIYSLLSKVSHVPRDELDDQVKEWTSDIREASYDMEDIIDTFLVRVEEKPTDASMLKCAMNKMYGVFRKGKARHDVNSAINDVMNQLEEVAARRARYRIDDLVVNSAGRSRYRIDDLVVNSAANMFAGDPRLPAMYNEVESLVGTEQASKDLIAKLSASQEDDTSKKKMIVAIVGIGGLGKTTLAKAVYDKIKAYFECAAFVPVGRNPSVAKVLMDILYELDKERFTDIHRQNRDERHLIDNLREFLQYKRYFIVIDDIWETKCWEERIKLPLLENNNGSRIIMTTRNCQVATEISDVVYRMQPLSDDNSKQLFYTRIFGAQGKWPDNEPDKIPAKILKKCDGVPLAIITMASLLAGKPREKWCDVFTSVGFGHREDKEVDNNTMKILSFSYYDMPNYLRNCLLYLSVYPEDYEIDIGPLIWKWIAEGFIQGKQGISLFHIGEQYFCDLVNRSLIQVVEEKWIDYMMHRPRCRVHDMVHDLICYISSKQNFATILDNDEGTVSSPPSNARRIAVHKTTLEQTDCNNMVNILKVRSFTAIRCSVGNWAASIKLLRVLDMEGCTNLRPSHLGHLKKLVLLRYLGLRNTKIDYLPNEIGDVKFLNTLNLEGARIRLLPQSISRLTQLVCLKLSGTSLAPNWIGKLTCLEELQVAARCTERTNEDHIRGFLKALGTLSKLTVFRISVLELDESMQRDLMLSLCNLHNLQQMHLFGITSYYLAETTVWGQTEFVLPQCLRTLWLKGIAFSCLPPCIGDACLPNLTNLALHVFNLDQKGLEFVGRLPELSVLYLNTGSTVTINNINANSGYFQKLRHCCLPSSMIQFECKEVDSSISIHIWKGFGSMPFSCCKINSRVAPYAVMPNLERLECAVMPYYLKDNQTDCSNIIGLEYLPSLRFVEAKRRRASAAEMDEVESALRKASEVHPNRPMLQISKYDRTSFYEERFFFR